MTDIDALPKAKTSLGTTTSKVGDAIGLQNRKWYIVIVNNNTEKQCAKHLAKLGYECYVPTLEAHIEYRKVS